MLKEGVSNHYVPRLVLRKFSDKLCLYNVKTGELRENISPEHAYVKDGLYDLETEKNLNERIESQFGNLLSNIILKADNEIHLSRKNLFLIKKFLLVSTLRSMHGESFAQREKNFYKTLQYKAKQMSELMGEKYDHSAFQPPFEEVKLPNETSFEYWMRTLNVILDTDGTPEEILKHPNKTYPAFRWSALINSAYIAFWDAPQKGDEFVITDIGMTSENEKGWNGITVHNRKKFIWMESLLKMPLTDEMKADILSLYHRTTSFSENFMMFSISARRMIVLISPFYKFRHSMAESGVEVPSLDIFTMMPNERLFEANRNYYVLEQVYGEPHKYHENDKYIYDIKQLTNSEIRYCNSLFLDRIDTYLGFSSLEHAVGSIIKYKKLNDPPHVPRVDYTELYKIIQKRYLGSLNV